MESILNQLSALRRRERGLRFVWGAARWLAIVLIALASACATDWWIDRYRDTPWVLRYALTITQAILALGLLILFVVRPLCRRLSDNDLALWVESRLPQFGHRLISAVQLNRPGADTKGMSSQMIAAVTREAGEQSSKIDFAALSDRRRLGWGLILAAPVLVLSAILALLWPKLTATLVARQFLADVDIPRQTALESSSPRVWPSGEQVLLSFQVSGRGALEPLTGYVRIDPEGRASELYELKPIDTGPSYLAAVYTAKIPPGATNFRYRAWLGDGRTREPSEVVYAPRPTVKKQDAWLQLPAYCGTRPDGRPYELAQPRGDIIGTAAMKARIVIETEPTVRFATLELLKRPAPEVLAHCRICTNLSTSPFAGPVSEIGHVFASLAVRQLQTQEIVGREALGPEFPARQHSFWKHPGRQDWEIVFDLRPEETAYRIFVEDENHYLNARPARRGIVVTPDEPPQVTLLPERFAPVGEQGLAEDVEIENMPLPIGEAIQVAYSCRDALGLDRAELRYRVNSGTWRRLVLREVAAEPDSGPFDLRRGAFANSSERAQVQFHALPSPAPDLTPGRLEGGGRFDFQTRGIAGLKLGDQIEYFVEVYDRNPEPGREPGHSEVRLKTVVSQQQFKDWVYRTLQHERRIRELEKKQRGVFDRPR